MKRTALRECIATYLQLAKEIKDLEQQQENITTRIKRHLGAVEEERIDNNIIRYTTVDTSRLDIKALQEGNEETYSKYLKTSTSRRFSIK